MASQWTCVNGKRYSLPTSEGQRLVEWLREDLGLMGTKEACGTGDCGCCSVLLNGDIVPSCCILVSCIANQEITTIEGIAAQLPNDPLFEAFIHCGALQCGYCTPGMIVAARSFLNHTLQTVSPSKHICSLDIRTAIAGNICRCTGYMQIIEAILVAASAHGLPCETRETFYLIGENTDIL